MRMNRQGGQTAGTLINTYSVSELSKIFSTYGELDNAHRVAKLIEQARNAKAITSVAELMEVLKPVLPKFDEHKYLAKVFQALRIEVNHEMKALEQMLHQTTAAIKQGGRLSVITYHSLEDRMVKNFIKSGNVEGEVQKDFYGRVSTPFEAVNKKVILPAEEEIQSNTRARSAKLRIAQRQ